MSEDANLKGSPECVPAETITSIKRRELINRLSKASLSLPVAAVIYNATTTIAHASP